MIVTFDELEMYAELAPSCLKSDETTCEASTAEF